MENLEQEDIQGLIFSGYGHLEYAAFVLLHAQSAADGCGWLAKTLSRVTTAEKRQEGSSFNLAFTWEGLKILNLDEVTLERFPPAFQQGMAVTHRARILGDTEDNAPSTWLWGQSDLDLPIHIMVMLYAASGRQLEQELDKLRKEMHRYRLLEVYRKFSEPLPKSANGFGREHFGFADGLSQPILRGSGGENKLTNEAERWSIIQPGEILLGYLNEYGKLPASPFVDPANDHAGILPGCQVMSQGMRDLGRNGSYLVMRELAQNVSGFWRFIDSATKDSAGSSDPDARERLGAKLVGRWTDGTPLTRSPEAPCPSLSSNNNFGYREIDTYGIQCPVGAHIRRTNPRDSLGNDAPEGVALSKRHRILRRGRAYGTWLNNPVKNNDEQERGLMFICLNSNLERQFEFVQNTWVNNTKFQGLYGEKDPIIGSQNADDSGIMSLPACPVRGTIKGIPRFTRTRGGAYFFFPGIRAMSYLSTLGA